MSNIISQFFYGPTGTSFNDDSDLLDLVSNSVITNMTTGEKFKKIDTNVFNKTTIPSDTVLYDTDQQLTEAQKQRARNNIGALGSVSLPISFDGGTITHGESYTQIRFALGPEYPGSRLFRWFIVRIGSIAVGGVSGVAVVKWDNPLPEHSYMDNATVQVTPSRGSTGGGRWGDDYFCLFTQNISKDGFEIYSNHLGDIGADGRVDYIFTALNTTQS